MRSLREQIYYVLVHYSSVSYTHLDVYKRQDCDRVNAHGSVGTKVRQGSLVDFHHPLDYSLW